MVTGQYPFIGCYVHHIARCQFAVIGGLNLLPLNDRPERYQEHLCTARADGHTASDVHVELM